MPLHSAGFAFSERVLSHAEACWVGLAYVLGTEMLRRGARVGQDSEEWVDVVQCGLSTEYLLIVANCGRLSGSASSSIASFAL